MRSQLEVTETIINTAGTRIKIHREENTASTGIKTASMGTPGMGMKTQLAWESKYSWHGNENTAGVGMKTQLAWE